MPEYYLSSRYYFVSWLSEKSFCHISLRFNPTPYLLAIMKLKILLQLAALTSAIVLPDEKILKDADTTSYRSDRHSLSTSDFWSRVRETYSRYSKHADDALEHCSHKAKDTFDDVTSTASQKFDETVHKDYFDAAGWLESASDLAERVPSVDEVFSADARSPHHRPGHGHHKPNQTVYQLIASSKYTTKLAEAINDYPDLVETLNGTKANYTGTFLVA